MRYHKKNLKNYNLFQNGQRTATDLPVTYHTGIEGEGRYTCNPFSLLTVEGDRFNAMPCPILTMQEIEVELKPMSCVQCVNFCLEIFQFNAC